MEVIRTELMSGIELLRGQSEDFEDLTNNTTFPKETPPDQISYPIPTSGKLPGQPDSKVRTVPASQSEECVVDHRVSLHRPGFPGAERQGLTRIACRPSTLDAISVWPARLRKSKLIPPP